VYRAAKEEAQRKSLPRGASFGHGISNVRTCAGTIVPICFRIWHGKLDKTRPGTIAFHVT
jgi:hypothetical protein